tara:strand:+ start:136 stop:339 length:204 start_codon:yes stop_codon:yes gene_type:complete
MYFSSTASLIRNKLTTKELATVQILINLGDTEKLALETVLLCRPTEAKKHAQLKDFPHSLTYPAETR